MSKRNVAIPVIVAAVVAFAVFVWVKFYRGGPEVRLANPEDQFRYGVVANAGAPEIPYWVWLVLPRIVPDLLPGPGGYPTLGVAWDLGQELPIGFSKRTAGYARVGTNCALCHTAVEKGGELEDPKFVLVKRPAGSTLNAYATFVAAAAKDQRFNADAIMDQINYAYNLGWTDKLLYRYWIIPATKRALRDVGIPSGAVHPKESPDWSQLEKWIEDNAVR